jgi:hypothetical protein
MKIYPIEISDGLEEAIASSNSVAYCSVAEKYNPNDQEIEQISKSQALDMGNEDQLDLFYMKSILVSTGWNKNDDVFDPGELWAARNTPEDKPFNFMHDEKDIIGHITGNVVVDYEGNEIEENTPEVPSEFNILTTSVIYTSWTEQEQKERMQKIVSEIEEGKWFVSMECLFPAFDYALVDDNGKTSVIPRNEASAFLTKHLKAYGGTGKYQNYQVGRLLRNLSFSGKGLVSRPANPRSIILEGNKLFDESKAYALEIHSLKENEMSDNLNQQIIDLQKELAETKAANQSLKEEVSNSKSAEFETTIKELTASLAAKTEEVLQLTEAAKYSKEDMEKKKEEMTAMQKKMKDMEEELAVMKKKEAMMKRKAELVDAGLDADSATSTAEDFSDADDEVFGRVLAAIKKSLSISAASVNEEPKAEEVKELDEEVDSSEANESDLDSVEETKEVTIAEVTVEDETESLRAVASEWLGSVLRSTPKNK